MGKTIWTAIEGEVSRSAQGQQRTKGSGRTKLGVPFFLWKAGCPQSPSVLGPLDSDGQLGQPRNRAQCAGEFVNGCKTSFAMSDAPYEVDLCRDLN